MLLAVKLRNPSLTATSRYDGVLTSLTGMEETPISRAINQLALLFIQRGEYRSTEADILEIPSSTLDFGWERVIIGEDNVGDILAQSSSSESDHKSH
jgi:hypothetical protein